MPPIPPGDHLYVVRSGDSLGGIAAKLYGDASRWRELWEKNPIIRNPHQIYPDQVLRLLAIGPETPKGEYPVNAMNKCGQTGEPSSTRNELGTEGEDIPELPEGIGPPGSMRTYQLEMLLNSLLNEIKSTEGTEKGNATYAVPSTSIHFPVMSLVFSAQTDSSGVRKYLVGNSTAYFIRGDQLQAVVTRPPASTLCERSRAVAELIDQYGTYLNGRRTEDEWLVYTKWMVLKDDLRYYAFLLTNVNELGKNFIFLKEPVDVLRIRIFSNEGYLYLTDKGLQGIPGFYYAADARGETIRITMSDPIIQEKYSRALDLFMEGISSRRTDGIDPAARKKLDRIF
jgi:hypothetical protein